MMMRCMGRFGDGLIALPALLIPSHSTHSNLTLIQFTAMNFSATLGGTGRRIKGWGVWVGLGWVGLG